LRQQLWRQAISRWWWRGLGGTAVLLAGAGLVHTLLWPLPFVPCVWLAMAPPLLALAVGLWRGRPSLASCAWLADQRFGGKSLLTSAWDLLSRPQSVSPASARLLLSQANQAAADWQGRLTAHRDINLPRQAVLSFSLSLVGLFLLSSPGALLNSTTASAVAADITAPAAAEPLDDARPSVGAGETAVSPPASAATAPVFGNERTGEKSATVESSAGPRPLSPAPPLAGSAVPVGRQPGQLATAVAPDSAAVPVTGASQSLGDNHPGDDSDRQTAAARTPPANPTLRYLDIERRAGAGVQTTTRESEDLAAVEPTSRPPTAAAAVPAERVAMPYETVAGPALRRYVADYFQEPEHDRQPD
jgi:hypothetical protein